MPSYELLATRADPRRVYKLILIISLCLLPEAQLVSAQGDPLALQQRAIQRLDAFIDQFRKNGDIRSRLPDLAQAEKELSESNKVLAARGNWSALALGLLKQGHIYRMQSQWPNAITLYQQAEEAAKRSGDIVQQADVFAWRALAESSRRNLGQAFADATQAVRLAETTDDKDVLARALDVLVSVQIAQRDLVAAADTANRGLDVAAQAKDQTAAYYAYLNRSDVYLKFGEKCDFQRSIEPCYQALDRARADLQQAVAIVKRLGYLALARQTEEFIRTVEARRGLIKSQEALYQAVQKISAFNPKKPGDVLVTENFVPRPGEVPPLLNELYQSAKRIEQEAGGLAEVSQARNHFVEGIINELRGNNDAALGSFLKAVDALEKDRRALRDERSRGTFIEDRINFYYAAIKHRLEKRQFTEAFDLLERSRSRVFADLLSTRKLGLARPGEQKLYSELMVLRTKISDAQSRLFELVSDAQSAKNKPQIRTLQDQIRTLEAQYQNVLSRVAVEAPRLQNLVTAAPVTLKELQKSMREERYEILQYLVIEEGVIVWHITAESVFVRNVFLPRSELIGKVATLQKSLVDRNVRFNETTARELFLFLVQPVLSRIKSDRLLIIPHDDLHYVPFQVFQDPADGVYLGERVQIAYAPSASVLLALKRSSVLSGARLLAVADPSIAAAVSEVQGIAKLFSGESKIVTGELARESDIKLWARDFDVVHLSVHGKFDTGEPLLSYLSLGRGLDDDGKLTAAEMFGLPLEKTRLVVLAAGETARVEVTRGNELLGMVRALIYAGAGTLVLSYWQPDSQSTALWMQSFYEAAMSRPTHEAARQALIKVKNNPAYSHPYYWAAFQVIGR